MPKGNENFTPKPIEVIARQTIAGLWVEYLGATKGEDHLSISTDPRSWETAEQKFKDAAEACRVAARSLALRQESAAAAKVESAWILGLGPKPSPDGAPLVPPHVHEFLKDYLGSDQHRPHACQVISIPAGSGMAEIAKILLHAMVKGGHTR